MSMSNPVTWSSASFRHLGDWHLVDSGYACAGVAVTERGVIIEAAPIFRKLVGQRLAVVLTRYREVT